MLDAAATLGVATLYAAALAVAWWRNRRARAEGRRLRREEFRAQFPEGVTFADVEEALGSIRAPMPAPEARLGLALGRAMAYANVRQVRLARAMRTATPRR